MELEYVVREPRSGAESLAPALIVLHGYGADEQDLLSTAAQLSDSLKIVSLRAPIELPWGGYAWYHLEKTLQGLNSDTDSRIQSEQLLIEQLPAIIAKEQLDPRNIFLLGFSQGAAMCYSLLARHDLAPLGITLRGVMALSGYLPRDIVEPMSQKHFDGLPVFISHGEFDELIPFIALDEASRALSNAGAVVTSDIYEIGHGIDQDILNDLKEWFAQHFSLSSAS